MGELRHRERELPLRRRGGPDRVDELREFRPGDPRAAALPLSVRQAELVGHSALARDRSGRRRRGHPRIWRGYCSKPHPPPLIENRARIPPPGRQGGPLLPPYNTFRPPPFPPRPP